MALAADLPVDCFYIYPTASFDGAGNSDLVTNDALQGGGELAYGDVLDAFEHYMIGGSRLIAKPVLPTAGDVVCVCTRR